MLLPGAITLAVALSTARRVAAQRSEAVCTSNYWMANSRGQDPCLVSAYLLSPCLSDPNTQVIVSALDEGFHYLLPSASELIPCVCSTVWYAAIHACAACQGNIGSASPWSSWTANCSDKTISGWPFQVPAGTSIPSWMFIDIPQSDGFNVTAAELLAADGQPDTTLAPPTQPSPTSSSSSTSFTPFEIPSISIELTRTTLIDITPTQHVGNLDPTTHRFATERLETQPTLPALASVKHSAPRSHTKVVAAAVVGSLFLIVGAAIAYVRWEVGRIGTRYPERSSSEVTLVGGEATLFGSERDLPLSRTPSPSPYQHVGWNPMLFREAEHPSMPVGDAAIISMPVPSTEYRLAGV